MPTLNDGIRYLSVRIRLRYPQALSMQLFPTLLWTFFSSDNGARAFPAVSVWPLFVGEQVAVPRDSPLAAMAGLLRFNHHSLLANRAATAPQSTAAASVDVLAQSYFDAFALYGVTAAAVAAMVQRSPRDPVGIAKSIASWQTADRAVTDEMLREFAASVPVGPWQPSLAGTAAFVAKHRPWALPSFQLEDLGSGQFMSNIVAREEASGASQSVMAGIKTARDTLLAHVDFLRSAGDGWMRPEV